VISNEELWRRAEETEISTQIKRQKWNWIGHTLRKGHDTIERGFGLESTGTMEKREA
jgi:hypothetical protein